MWRDEERVQINRKRESPRGKCLADLFSAKETLKWLTSGAFHCCCCADEK